VALGDQPVGQSMDSTSRSIELTLAVELQEIFARNAESFNVAGLDDSALPNIPNRSLHLIWPYHLFHFVII
jgi:hypothetical protein